MSANTDSFGQSVCSYLLLAEDGGLVNTRQPLGQPVDGGGMSGPDDGRLLRWGLLSHQEDWVIVIDLTSMDLLHGTWSFMHVCDVLYAISDLQCLSRSLFSTSSLVI